MRSDQTFNDNEMHKGAVETATQIILI